MDYETEVFAPFVVTKDINLFQVMVGIDEDNSVGCNIQIKVNGILRKFTNDPDFDLKIEMLDYGDGDSDMEELFNEQANEEPEIETTSILNKPPLGLQLTKRPRRRKKVLSKITPFPCEHCGKTLIGRGNLVAHIKRIHLKQRDHKCKICQKAFNTSSALESHVLAVHTRRCENCQEYVIETEPWTEGMTMKTRRQVACECGELVDVICLFGRRKVYEDDDEELREKKRNYDPTKYACQHCGKLFASRSHCLRHARKHTGSKDIHCQYCQESFRYENSLKKHLKSEHRIFQTHYCNICKVEFDSAVELETHKKHFHGLKSSESRKLKTGPAESKLVKCTTKVITALPTVKTVPVPAENRTSSASSSHHQESSSDIGTSLQKMLGTSQSPGDTEVAMRTVGGHVLDKDTYDLVQQALQGDQIFSQDGNTIIIRTVPT